VTTPEDDETTRLNYFEAPNYWLPATGDPPAVFLAGGITGCPAWHQHAIQVLRDSSVSMIVLNPARENFPIDDPNAGWEQVRWEQYHLHLPRVVTMMWFPEPLAPTTVQPIAQFELGQLTESTTRTFAVGSAPGYPRRRDVHYMMRYHRPDKTVHSTLDQLLEATVQLVEAVSLR
jgi:hypothetical protein